MPLRLAEVLEPRLKGSGLYELFTDLEMPLIDVLVEMEFNGIRVDVEPAARAVRPVQRADHAAGAGDF